MYALRRFAVDRSTFALAILAVTTVSSCVSTSTGVDDTPEVGSIAIQGSAPVLTALAATTQLGATVLDDAGGTIASPSISWASANTGVATVSAGGLVTAVANGTSLVTATAGAHADTVTVTVAQVPVSVTVLAPVDTLRTPDETAQLVGLVVDANGYEVVSSGSWSSSNEAVLTVDASGIVTAVGAGTAVLTYDIGALAGAVSLEVAYDLGGGLLSIAFDNDTIFAEGGVLATATVLNASGGELLDLDLTWTSSDPSLSVETVQIDADGRSVALLHSSLDVGTFWVRAETPDAMIDSAAITIVAAPPAQGVSIDFETLPTGGPTCTATYINGGCNLGTAMAAWGVTFRFVDVSAGGGDGTPNLVTFDTGKTLLNDRGSAGFLTGSHEIRLSVDVAEFGFRIQWPGGGAPSITVYDVAGNEVAAAVVVRAADGTSADRVTVHSPVLIGRVKIGPYGGLLFLDDLVY